FPPRADELGPRPCAAWHRRVPVIQPSPSYPTPAGRGGKREDRPRMFRRPTPRIVLRPVIIQRHGRSTMTSFVEKNLSAAAGHVQVPFAVRLSDGRRFTFRSGEPAFTLVFRNGRAERRTALFGHIGLLESYFDGDLDVEGSLRQAFALGLSGGLDHA